MSTEFSAAVAGYLKELRSKLQDATELTHRSALEKLIEGLGTGILAASDPKQRDWGKPDFSVSKRGVPLGNIETKDIEVALDAVEDSEQLKRYLAASPNLILTDYLDFRWFVDGKKRFSAKVAKKHGNKLLAVDGGVAELERMLGGFINERVAIVASAGELAEHMARKTEQARKHICDELQTEVAAGPLHDLLTAFRSVLISDLKEMEFAGMFAQTLAYGLFAAWIHTQQSAPNAEFSLETAWARIPKTNPFLHRLFHQIAGELPERVADTARDLVDLLNRARMDEVLKDFGKGKGKDDPVVHFYEDFLRAYDPKEKTIRGVFYTPVPAVSFVVRSVDYLLKKRFGCPEGLADASTVECRMPGENGEEVVKQVPRVLVLDIATGTGTFLYYLVSYIYQQRFANQQGAWNSYVTEHLLERIFGFELLMAPYAVAHLKLGMLLKDTGYNFTKNNRLGIYLTNTLDEAIHKSEQLLGKWLSDEANEAAEIKKFRPIMVLMGNPPYSKSVCKGKWIMSLVADYKKGLQEKKSDLNREEWKFLRFAQWRIEKTGQGIVALVINNTFLDAITHRRMRQCLMEAFNEIYVLNLHGSTNKKERAPDGGKDENIFDIKQGVCIVILVKLPGGTGSRVFHGDLWHDRESKYQALLESDVSGVSTELNPVAPNYFFTAKNFACDAEYSSQCSITNVFTLSGQCVKTERDRVSIHFTPDDIAQAIQDFKTLDESALREKYKLGKDSRDWQVAKAKTDVTKNTGKDLFRPILYRPFDIRYTWYSGKTRGFIGTPGFAAMRHMIAGDNLGLHASRTIYGPTPWRDVLATKYMAEFGIMATRVGNSAPLFPLYLYPDDNRSQRELHRGEERRPNLSPAFLKTLSDKLRLPQTQPHGLPDGIAPEDIFHYAYAVFHSPTYRQRYAEFLKIDYPRLPLTGDINLFRALAAKGAELVALHVLESDKLKGLQLGFCGDGKNAVEKVQYTDVDQRVWLNASQYFDAVPKNIWEFYVGGYQPCKKWLDDRRKAKRKLSFDDMQHYRKIVIALGETIRLMGEIDLLIPRWPLE